MLVLMLALLSPAFIDHYDAMCADKPYAVRYSCLAERQQSALNWEASAFAVYDEYNRVIDAEEVGGACDDPLLARAYFERGQLGLYLVFQEAREAYLSGVVPDFARAVELDPQTPTYALWVKYAQAVVTKSSEEAFMGPGMLAFAACDAPDVDAADVCGDFYVSPPSADEEMQ